MAEFGHAGVNPFPFHMNRRSSILCRSHHESNRINMRELHDALDEKFHHKGGIKYLYNLFPGGPIAQGWRLGGLQHPAGALDKGFGSAV